MVENVSVSADVFCPMKATDSNTIVIKIKDSEATSNRSHRRHKHYDLETMAVCEYDALLNE